MNWKAVIGIGLVAALLAFGFLAVQNGESIIKAVHTTVLDGNGNSTDDGPHPPIPDVWTVIYNPDDGPHPPYPDAW